MAKKFHDKHKNKHRSKHQQFSSKHGEFDDEGFGEEDSEVAHSFEDELAEVVASYDANDLQAAHAAAHAEPLSSFSNRFDYVEQNQSVPATQETPLSFPEADTARTAVLAEETVTNPEPLEEPDFPFEVNRTPAKAEKKRFSLPFLRNAENAPSEEIAENSAENLVEKSVEIEHTGEESHEEIVSETKSSVLQKLRSGLAFCSLNSVKQGFWKIIAVVFLGFCMLRTAASSFCAFLNRWCVQPILSFNQRFSNALGIEETSEDTPAGEEPAAASTPESEPESKPEPKVEEQAAEELFVDAKLFDAPMPQHEEKAEPEALHASETEPEEETSAEDFDEEFDDEFDEEEYEAAIRAARKKLLLLAGSVLLLIGGFFAVQQVRGKLSFNSQLAEAQNPEPTLESEAKIPVKSEPLPTKGLFSPAVASVPLEPELPPVIEEEPVPAAAPMEMNLPFVGDPLFEPEDAQDDIFPDDLLEVPTEAVQETSYAVSEETPGDVDGNVEEPFVPEIPIAPTAIAHEGAIADFSFDLPLSDPEEQAAFDEVDPFEDIMAPLAEETPVAPPAPIAIPPAAQPSQPMPPIASAASPGITPPKTERSSAAPKLTLSENLQNHRYTKPSEAPQKREMMQVSAEEFAPLQPKPGISELPEVQPTYAVPNPPYRRDASAVQAFSEARTNTDRAVTPFGAERRRSRSIAERGLRPQVAEKQTEKQTPSTISEEAVSFGAAVRDSEDYGRLYVAQEGDNLFNIAKNELGAVARWKEIRQLNRDVLNDSVGYLTPGTELRLPQ